jgi:Flp pilus assembly protein TadG
VVELVVTTPVLLLAVLLIVQIGLWQHARHVALAAAREGARAAREYHGTAEAGRRAAEDYLNALAPTLLRPRTVTAERTATTATVRVEGRLTSLVPGLAVRVGEVSTGAVERFVPSR